MADIYIMPCGNQNDNSGYVDAGRPGISLRLFKSLDPGVFVWLILALLVRCVCDSCVFDDLEKK